MDEKSVQTSFEIIAMSGEARSKAYEALDFAKQGDFDQAKATMADAQEASNKAHAIQTDLITRAARGEELPSRHPAHSLPRPSDDFHPCH